MTLDLLATFKIKKSNKKMTIKDFEHSLMLKFLRTYTQEKIRKDIRLYGHTTNNILDIYKRTGKIKRDYNPLGGGNGAAVRTAPIGLIYYKPEKIHELIHYSITTSKLTHNNAIGYLGGLTKALLFLMLYKVLNQRTGLNMLLILLKTLIN